MGEAGSEGYGCGMEPAGLGAASIVVMIYSHARERPDPLTIRDRTARG